MAEFLMRLAGELRAILCPEVLIESSCFTRSLLLEMLNLQVRLCTVNSPDAIGFTRILLLEMLDLHYEFV